MDPTVKLVTGKSNNLDFLVPAKHRPIPLSYCT